MSSLLEKLAYKLVPETKKPDTVAELDERLSATPAAALVQCHELTYEMARTSIQSLKNAIHCLTNLSPEAARDIRDAEEKADHYEDIIGTYLIKLSSSQISDRDGAEAAKLLKIIGDLERLSDHAVNLLDSAEELKTKNLSFSPSAINELSNASKAMEEILDFSLIAFVDNDMVAATSVEPLEQIIDKLKDCMRNNHILRMQQGDCSFETGFIWSDILTNLERASDHCSNIAGCVIDAEAKNLNLHESIRAMKADSTEFKERYASFAAKYL